MKLKWCFEAQWRKNNNEWMNPFLEVTGIHYQSLLSLSWSYSPYSSDKIQGLPRKLTTRWLKGAAEVDTSYKNNFMCIWKLDVMGEGMKSIRLCHPKAWYLGRRIILSWRHLGMNIHRKSSLPSPDLPESRVEISLFVGVSLLWTWKRTLVTGESQPWHKFV